MTIHPKHRAILEHQGWRFPAGQSPVLHDEQTGLPKYSNPLDHARAFETYHDRVKENHPVSDEEAVDNTAAVVHDAGIDVVSPQPDNIRANLEAQEDAHKSAAEIKDEIANDPSQH